MIKFCQKCYENKDRVTPSGYSAYLYDDNLQFCPTLTNGEPHNCEFINIDFPADDFLTLRDISETKEFIDAMIKLYQTDIIEYELKMSQFRTQAQQQKQAKQQAKQQSAASNKVQCPYCKSTNVKKISLTSKAVGLGVFGWLGASKVVHQYHCNSCKSDF